MPRSCVKNLRHSSFWNPPISFWFLHCQSPVFIDCSLCMFNILSHSACCRPCRMCGSLSAFMTIFEASVPHFYLRCAHFIVSESPLSHPNRFHRGMFKLNTNLMHMHCSTHSVILNVTATQYTCSLKGVYHPHGLVQ